MNPAAGARPADPERDRRHCVNLAVSSRFPRRRYRPFAIARGGAADRALGLTRRSCWRLQPTQVRRGLGPPDLRLLDAEWYFTVRRP